MIVDVPASRSAAMRPPLTSDDRPHVLCVDDEVSVLEGLRDTLRRDFVVEAATSGADGLALLRQKPRRFAVVISDMRMPEMSGSAFLGQVRRVAPLATRMLLTGHADLDAAMRAVNDGQIFRFLGKPCPPDELLQACAAAVWQHRLLASERALADQTLHGCLQALAEVLALANPEAFARGTRARRMISRLAADIDLQDPWELETAAVLVNLDALSPAAGERVLRMIPRLEGVVQIVSNYQRRFDSIERDGLLPLGARALRIVFDYDDLETTGQTGAAALAVMASRQGTYDPELLAVFAPGLAESPSRHPDETTTGSRGHVEAVL